MESFVFASSGGVLYGDVYEPAAEDRPLAPVSPYGISKLAGENYLRLPRHSLVQVCTQRWEDTCS